MNHQKLERFHKVLQEHKDTLLEWRESNSTEHQIHLGGTKKSEVFQLISKLESALESVESGEFGKCE